MAKHNYTNDLPLSEEISRLTDFDLVVGDITVNTPSLKESSPFNTELIDRDIVAHVQHFAEELPNRLDLKSLNKISLHDPQGAIHIIKQLRSNVERELQKAQSLRKLCVASGI